MTLATLRLPIALLCAVGLVTSGCRGEAQRDPVTRQPVPSPVAQEADEPATDEDDPATTPGDQDGGPRPPAETPQTVEGEPPPASQAADDGPIGHNARAYLQGSVPRLVVEVSSVGGRGSDAALGHLRAKLGEVADKPGGIEVRRAQIPQAKDRYTLDDLRALDRAHRRTSTTGDVASVHILFLNGRYEREEVLGVVYSASAYAIFTDQIRGIATPLVSAERIERSVVLHEAGHLLGLLNLGFRSPREREDPDHPHHSSNPDSVMYWAIESTLVVSVLRGPPPDDFDADDRADLADLRAGRL